MSHQARLVHGAAADGNGWPPMSALPVLYAVRGSSSVTGTRSEGPWTQMVPQCDELPRGRRGEADEVDDHLRAQRGDPLAERSPRVFRLPAMR